MGGNVFPGLNRRYAKDEYLALVNEVAPILDMIFKVWNVTPTFASKEDFGDMDIIGVPKFSFNADSLAAFFNIHYVSSPGSAGYLPIKNNGGTWSLIYKDFQIDLVTCPEHEYAFTKNYMGVGDRGNFVGKIAHMLGLKFGHDGMWMVVRADDSHQLGEVLLTLDPREAEAFLDIQPLMDNPQTLEDIFENVAASQFFNPEVFLLENNNNVARVRDRKRPSYNAMLEWCKTLPPREYFPRVKDKSIYLPAIFSAFPHARDEYELLWAKKQMLDIYRTKLNGDLVREWTGREYKELGILMVDLKEALDTYTVAYEMTVEEVEAFVKKFVKEQDGQD